MQLTENDALKIKIRNKPLRFDREVRNAKRRCRRWPKTQDGICERYNNSDYKLQVIEKTQDEIINVKNDKAKQCNSTQ